MSRQLTGCVADMRLEILHKLATLTAKMLPNLERRIQKLDTEMAKMVQNLERRIQKLE
jgi:hypothetical protein